MDVGLLWYDDDPRRGLEDKIDRAAQRYREKYGRWPNTCYVHPQIVDDQGTGGLRLAYQGNSAKSTIRVLTSPNILVHHFWVGETNGDAGDSGLQASR